MIDYAMTAFSAVGLSSMLISACTHNNKIGLTCLVIASMSFVALIITNTVQIFF